MIRETMNNEKGISMVMVIVIAVILFTIGIVIVSVSANNLTSVNEERNDKQAYYGARSTLRAVDSAIKSGDLGKKIRDLAAAGTLPTNDIAESITFSDPDLSDEISITDFKITPGNYNSEVGGTGDVTISDMVVSITAEYNGKKYKLTATYDFAGKATAQGSRFNWSESAWTVTDVD